jgi:hypothetical protein
MAPLLKDISVASHWLDYSCFGFTVILWISDFSLFLIAEAFWFKAFPSFLTASLPSFMKASLFSFLARKRAGVLSL